MVERVEVFSNPKSGEHVGAAGAGMDRQVCAGGWVEPGPSLVAWRGVFGPWACAVWRVSPFTVGRSPSTRCKTAGCAGAERSEGSLGPRATVTRR